MFLLLESSNKHKEGCLNNLLFKKMTEIIVETILSENKIKEFLKNEESLLTISVDCSCNKRIFFGFYSKSIVGKEILNESFFILDLLTLKGVYINKEHLYCTYNTFINGILTDIQLFNSIKIFSISSEEKTKFLSKLKKEEYKITDLETLLNFLFTSSYDWNKFIKD
jgi:hypothetical protein